MFINPLTGKKHRKWEVLHRAIGQQLGHPRRGCYDELTFSGARDILALFRAALDSEYADFDKKGRGDALNHDLYGYDPSQGVAVIQARHAFRRYRNGYMNVRKSYFLCGRNEITGEFFRHPVSSHAVRAAINSDPDPVETVRAVQRWLWEVSPEKLAQSVRQGDILLVPEKRVPDLPSTGASYTVGDSHVITADEIRLNGRCYALNPSVIHSKGQHAPIAHAGWCSIRVAREADAWNFATRLGD